MTLYDRNNRVVDKDGKPIVEPVKKASAATETEAKAEIKTEAKVEATSDKAVEEPTPIS
jgi:hypothetical protein